MTARKAMSEIVMQCVGQGRESPKHGLRMRIPDTYFVQTQQLTGPELPTYSSARYLGRGGGAERGERSKRGGAGKSRKQMIIQEAITRIQSKCQKKTPTTKEKCQISLSF
jgi:hypothetical protein